MLMSLIVAAFFDLLRPGEFDLGILGTLILQLIYPLRIFAWGGSGRLLSLMGRWCERLLSGLFVLGYMSVFVAAVLHQSLRLREDSFDGSLLDTLAIVSHSQRSHL